MIEDKWNESFGREDFVYGTDANVFFKEHADRFEPDSKIACLAEGEGRNAVHLTMLGHEVTAYDISNVGLNKARTLAETNNVSINTEQINLVDEVLYFIMVKQNALKDLDIMDYVMSFKL